MPAATEEPERTDQRPPSDAADDAPRRASRSAARAPAPSDEKPHDAPLPELGLAPPLRRRARRAGPRRRCRVPGSARRRGRACATLQAAWPQPHLTSPTSSRRICAASSAASTPVGSPQPRRRISRTRGTTSGGCSTTRASRRDSSTGRAVRPAAARPRRHERCLPDDAGLGRPAPRRLRPRTSRRVARELRPRAIAFVGKEAYRGVFGERPELGPQPRELESSGLFVLPSTSPANAAVPYAERLSWFRALHAWLEPVPRDGRPRARARRCRSACCCSAGRTRSPAPPGGSRPAAGSRRARPTRRAPARAPGRARARRDPTSVRVVWRADARHAVGRQDRRAAGALPRGARRPARRRAARRPRRRERPRPPLVDARRARCHRRARPRRLRSPSSCGASLAFSGRGGPRHRPPARRDRLGRRLDRARLRRRPAIRTLDGEPRGTRDERDRPALAPARLRRMFILAITGVPLAQLRLGCGRSPFQTVLWVKIA